MRNAIYNNEYISNKKQVYDILKKKTYSLTFLGVGYMNKNRMYHYQFSIDNMSFDYYEGLGHEKLDKKNKGLKIINALWCILKDADAINFLDSVSRFMQEYGYTDIDYAIKLFDLCKDTKEKLARLFTKEELQVLNDNINL